MTGSVDSSMIQENIEEYVNDENKIVTCRWLSLTLNIHINIAKQALYTYITAARNKGGNDDVNVTYFVAGLGQSKTGEPTHKCVVVPESHLDIVKSDLNPVTSCHVYSVQKVKLKDTTALYQTDYDIIKENLTVSPSLSSIRCPWAVLRETQTSQPTKASKPVEKESSKPAVKTSTGSKDASVRSNGTNSSSASKTATKKKPEAKGSIATMFASAGKKGDGQKGGGDGQKATVSDKTQSSKQKPKAADKKGGMMAFVSAQAKDFSEKIEIPKKTESVKSEEKKVKDVKEKTKEKPSRKTKQKQNSDDEPLKKSRRRIKTDLFDSSDDESEEERVLSEEEEVCALVVDDEEPQEMSPAADVKEEEEEEKPAEPEPKKGEKTSPPSSDGARKRKRTRKLVPKQYVDEDGFMVTEKVWESDSTDASDTEAAKKAAEKAKPEPSKTSETKTSETKTSESKPSAGGQKTEAKGKKAAKKSVALPQKGKQQASLMSFFTKK